MDPTDLSVLAKLLLDEKFSSKYKLLEKVGDDESLRQLFELTKVNLSIVEMIVRKMQSSESRIGILKEIVDAINGEPDEKVRARQTGDYSLGTIRKEILRSLVSGGNTERVLSLIDEGYLEVSDAKSLIHEIPSDGLLLSLASRCRDKKSATYIFKFITDKTVFAKIVESHGEEFKNLSESDRTDVVALAERFGEVLVNQSEVYPTDSFKETNKFIVGIPSDENKLFVAWSNTESHEYHKDIFTTLSKARGKKFPENLRSGGYVEIQDEKDGKRKVVFSRSSGDFGNYSNRLLELYKDAILNELKKELGEQVDLQIEVSS